PKLENLVKIARTFEVSTDWILTGAVPSEAAPAEAQDIAVFDAASWKDDHITYLKRRIQELEQREASAIQLKDSLSNLQEFVL
ncbi:helix-turn-helix domain-containing protein, partial [Klebsiella pneumoniae]|nr:helix-turn-helix domain-containing protein [Klebsiella pneumoniae]